jgi:hypothetical protein
MIDHKVFDTWQKVVDWICSWLAPGFPEYTKSFIKEMGAEAQKYTDLVKLAKERLGEDISEERMREIVRAGLRPRTVKADIECCPLFTEEQRENLLTSAIEGGSNYWYWIGDRAGCMIAFVGRKDDNEPLVAEIWRTLKAGIEIPIHELVDPGQRPTRLGFISLESMENAERIMFQKYPEAFADVISGNDDANTADIWFQLAVMGDIVYG